VKRRGHDDRKSTEAYRGPVERHRRVIGAVASFVLVGVIGFIANVTGIFAFVQEQVRGARPPPPMSGDLNVAVAGFSSSGPNPKAASSVARRLAESVLKGIQHELSTLQTAGFDIQTRSPKDAGRVSAAAPERRVRQLQDLARKAHADIVVAGDVVVEAGRTTLVPEFYLAGAKLRDAEELSGYHRLGALMEPGNPEENPVARREFRERLLRQTQGLARFIVVLGFYNHLDFTDADRELTAARQLWADPTSGALVYLFLGNAAGKRGDFLAAERYYAKALDVQPGYREPDWASPSFPTTAHAEPARPAPRIRTGSDARSHGTGRSLRRTCPPGLTSIPRSPSVWAGSTST
jgi:hypothetical protein